MKKSNKMKKMAAILYQEMKKIDTCKNEPDMEMKQPLSCTDINFLDYDDKMSDRIYNFILSLLKVKDKIRIEVREDNIYINGNINNLKKSNSNSNTLQYDDILDIRVSKESVSISRNYNNSVSYKDPNIYDRIYNIMLEKSKQINKDILNDIIDDVMLKGNLTRENNIDELLNNN